MFRIANFCSMFFAWLVLFLPISAIAASTVQCFSDLSRHPIEDDYVGFNICLMEHKRGLAVIFQEAEGSLEPPLLVEGRFAKGRLIFELPSSAIFPGEWKATVTKRGMVITNPAGNIYRLKPISFL